MRSSCEQARERVSLQLDDELSAHETVLLERHLDWCGACAGYAAGVREYTQLLRATPLEAAPQFWFERRPAARRAATRIAAVTAAAAAAVLVAVSTVPLGGSAVRASAGFGYWPIGLAVSQRGDGNLGVQRAALRRGVPAASAAHAGPRRGTVST